MKPATFLNETWRESQKVSVNCDKELHSKASFID